MRLAALARRLAERAAASEAPDGGSSSSGSERERCDSAPRHRAATAAAPSASIYASPAYWDARYAAAEAAGGDAPAAAGSRDEWHATCKHAPACAYRYVLTPPPCAQVRQLRGGAGAAGGACAKPVARCAHWRAGLRTLRAACGARRRRLHPHHRRGRVRGGYPGAHASSCASDGAPLLMQSLRSRARSACSAWRATQL